MLALADPGRQPRGEVALLRPAAAREQFDEIAQPAVTRLLLVIGDDGGGDGRLLLRAGPFSGLADEAGDERAEERPVLRRALVLERIEAGRRAGAKCCIVTADAAQEYLGATILVEEDGTRREAARLGGK